MKCLAGLLLLATGTAVLCFAYPSHERWTVREEETIEKTLNLSGAPMRVIVDNVDGYVHVTGTNGSQVHVVAHKTIRAETDSDLQEAKQDVKLDMTEKPGAVSIYYDAPWRCNGEGRGCQGDHRHFYEVAFDIDVQVPRSARAVISTVNGGDVRLSNTDGDFEVKDINGGIALSGVSGSGEVNTINGPVSAHFAKNPVRDTSFKSINGALDIYLQPDLSANLRFKTFNGGVYTDFDVLPLPTTGEASVEGAKFVYRSRGTMRGRVGNGGPELSFDTLNGTVRMHRER